MIADIDTAEAAPWAELRTRLQKSKYTTSEVRRLLGLTESAETILSNVARYSLLYLRDLELHRTPCAVLARLFLFNGWITPYQLGLLPIDLVGDLLRRGFIESAYGGRLVRATVSITEYSGRYFLSDQLFENSGDDLIIKHGAALCMPPHASSFELLRALRGPKLGSSFLDAGCGTGCQSILFANGLARVDGFDSSERCVMFAKANALLNDFPAQYTADRWENFIADEGRYDHIVFNPPDPRSAFGFLATRATELLADDGMAQILIIGEMLKTDANLDAMVERRIGRCPTLRISVTANENSLFSLSETDIRARILPRQTLLVADPSEGESYLEDLATRGVVEVVSAVVTARSGLA
jgi:SAM-dependent methyltransferase